MAIARIARALPRTAEPHRFLEAALMVRRLQTPAAHSKVLQRAAADLCNRSRSYRARRNSGAEVDPRSGEKVGGHAPFPPAPEGPPDRSGALRTPAPRSSSRYLTGSFAAEVG